MTKEGMTLPELVQQSFTTFRSSGAFFYRRGDGFSPLSSEHFLETIRRMALGFAALGLKRGDVVAIIANSSPWWLMVDLAIMLAGGYSTAVFPKISKQNLAYQLKDSACRFAYVDDPELWTFAQSECKSLKKVILRDVAHQQKSNYVNFNDLLKKGDQLSLAKPELYRQLCAQLKPDDIATIIYTSGSTGDPKGVVLSHNNLCSQIVAAIQRYPLDHSKDRALSALPLAHCFERTVVYTYFCQGVPIYFADDVQKLKEYLPIVEPTIMTMVPRILEKLYSKLHEKIDSSSSLIKALGNWSVQVGHQDNANALSKFAADKLLFKKIRSGLGGRLKTVIAGGAALDEHLCRFFINAGIPIYQGYGLTETSPVLTANYPGHNHPGTVGPAFPDVLVEIRGEEGEIRCKGPNIMLGYHKMPEYTASRFDDDGWFCTGDTGVFDKHGNLIITGRLSDICKTSTGKFVSPVPLEQALLKHPLVDAAMVIADGRSFVSALLFAEGEAFQRAFTTYQNSPECAESQDADHCIMQSLQKHVDQINATINDWEKIRSFRLITEEPTIESGLLTPTMKLCRGKVSERHAELITSMYSHHSE
ncbi:long-chain fatty acid--CoA ligase [Psychromonas sp. MME2]|uniref:AMP-dependent synthetase/ligase n=1 Tax=unclassified Psychromonas TaxID=2614957 RepID=UPI00339BA782